MASDDQKDQKDQKEDQKGKENPWESKPAQKPTGKPSGGNASGPPPLDQFFKNLFKKVAPKIKPAGNNSANKNNKKKSGDELELLSFKLFGLIVLILIIVWAGSGFYIVKPAEQAVVLRFGQYLETVGPGPHWVPTFIETDQIVNIDQVSVINQSGLMLTSEENLVQVAFVVKYRISDPEAYLFNVQDPVNSLEEITNSAVRQVVGHSELTDILTDGRSTTRDAVEQEIKTLVARYDLGLTVLDVDMQSAGAPDQVKDAFDDVIKAREDQVTYINNGNTYANQVVPKAKGQAARILQQADADQKQAVLLARGEAADFDALLPQYKLSPQVTRERMYLEAMQQSLMGSHVVVVDSVSNGQNALYLTIPGASSSPSSGNLFKNLSGSDQSQGPVISATGSQESSQAGSQVGSQVDSQVTNQATSDTSSSGNTLRNDYLRWQEAQNNAS